MTFLEPALWWAAPLAAAPVVIHLLFLRRARTFWFSDLTLLRRAYLKTLPTSRLRDWLLLACRSLALLALVAAFAGPVVAPGARWAGVGASREGLSLVLLLDTSYSMGLRVAGTTRLELARKAGRALLSALGPEDRVAAAAFADRPPGLAWARSPREADAALDAPLTLRGTDASAALRTAYAFLSSEPGARKGVVLLSDNSAHAFPGGAPSPPSGVKVLGLGWRDQPSNAYAADLQSRPLASGGVELVLEGAGSPEGPSRARLWLQGRPAGDRPFRIPGSASWEAHAPGPGWVWGWAELREDGLSADDRLYFARPLPDRPRVLVLSSGGDYFEPGRGGRFLKRLLGETERTLLPFEVDFQDLGRFRASDLQGCRAAVLAARHPLAEEAAAALKAFVEGGGGLLILLEPGLQVGGLSGLERHAAAQPGPESMLSDRGVRLEDAPDASPWRFRWSDFDLDRLSVSRAHALQPNPGAKVWMRGAEGRLLLVERPFGEGRTLMWAAGLEPSRTNLVLKPFFAAWLTACLGHLARIREPDRPPALAVGEPWTSGALGPGEGEAFVETPEKRRIRLPMRDRSLVFGGGESPGIYWLERGGSREPFAVNLDRSSGESDLSLLAPWPFALLDPASPADELRTRFFGRPVRWAFLWAALVLLTAESLLAGRPREG